jgi:hypothetical protein
MLAVFGVLLPPIRCVLEEHSECSLIVIFRLVHSPSHTLSLRVQIHQGYIVLKLMVHIFALLSSWNPASLIVGPMLRHDLGG